MLSVLVTYWNYFCRINRNKCEWDLKFFSSLCRAISYSPRKEKLDDMSKFFNMRINILVGRQKIMSHMFLYCFLNLFALMLNNSWISNSNIILLKKTMCFVLLVENTLSSTETLCRWNENVVTFSKIIVYRKY